MGTCDCGNTFEYYESLDEHQNISNDSAPVSKEAIIDDLIVIYESVTAWIILYCIYELPFPKSENDNEDIVYLLKNSPSGEKRANAAYLIGKSRTPDYIPYLCEATKDKNVNVRRLSASALGKINDPKGIDPLISLLNDEKRQVRQYAAQSLGKIGDVRALPYLKKTSMDLVNYVKDAAQEAIRKIRGKTKSSYYR